MTALAIVAPVFVLILLGYLAVRTRFVSEGTQKGLAEFAFSMATPALLFRTIATGKPLDVSPLTLWAVYFSTLALVWAASTLWTRHVLRRPAIDAASIAMTSTYGNVVMLGIPLCLATFGEAAAAPMAIILSIHTPFLWSIGTLHHQLATRAGGPPVDVFVGILKDLARNPLIVAIVAGGLWRLSGLGLAPLVDRVLALLGQAAIPASLITLGMSLAAFAIKGQGATLASVIGLKLLLMPALAAALALALDLPPVAAGVAILFAAMPAGANAYLFAAKVERAVNSASGAVALGTILAALTASALVAILRPLS